MLSLERDTEAEMYGFEVIQETNGEENRRVTEQRQNYQSKGVEIAAVTEIVPPNRIDVVEWFLIASSVVLPSRRSKALLRVLSKNWDGEIAYREGKGYGNWRRGITGGTVDEEGDGQLQEEEGWFEGS
ncbi:unnamed protein product [Vicia faba]|uniref:Uncharacterized protein n=1 Tax=Vicia faba TaxID=3906 RepID=A0AAV0Z417_VICFA|nr:unnamed protein product [Vicia faba]